MSGLHSELLHFDTRLISPEGTETSANEYNTLDNIPKSIQRRKLDISVNISFAVATRKFDTAHADSNYRSGSFSDEV